MPFTSPRSESSPPPLSPYLAQDDWLAIWLGAIVLSVSLVLVAWFGNDVGQFVAKPGGWRESPVAALIPTSAGVLHSPLVGSLVVGGALCLLFAVAQRIRGERVASFVPAFAVIFLLALMSFVLAGHEVVKAYNLEYALWALMVGLIISNTIGTPRFLRPAVLTEFYIKTGLVLLGAEVLMSRLVALGLPGIGVAWVVTPIVLITTYWFGQRVLKMPSRTLNMVISADMSVCGVSAAIATAAACRAKKEELSLAISLSLTFTVVMMAVLPMVIQAIGLDPYVGGAWLGGTIDSTGAVAAAGAALGDTALEVAATVKMIQNILIGVTAFCVAVYWTTRVDASRTGERVGAGEIWRRFPKFVLGFLAASIVFSVLHAFVPGGAELTEAMIKTATKTCRSWLFCLAFVCIGLETNFRQLLPQLKGGKPLALYVCGQSLNLCLTLLMAWLMFGVLFPPNGN
ncbi:YeiH family protein [Aeoliella sp. ICT_H6.2]|uniref:YeiH family protein n=1 Tax=Aeoliella straminimaris TaxID=2954799 RepID=A0A9X2FJP7_9BACT|nr:putative sulfate exporter family transporter [Aeoliella straminimaris]MCO6047611.1 YeiH family protein [Aeoliella straminimaris]